MLLFSLYTTIPTRRSTRMETMSVHKETPDLSKKLDELVFTFNGRIHIIEDGSEVAITIARKKLHKKWPGRYHCLVHSLPDGTSRMIVTHRE